jgi:epoxide hydrolase 4
MKNPQLFFCTGFPNVFYAQKRFRANAPDQRGYHLSNKPSGVKAYRLDHLVRDMEGLIGAAGNGKAIIVGP